MDNLEAHLEQVATYWRLISTPNTRGQLRTQTLQAHRTLDLASEYLKFKPETPAYIHSNTFAKELGVRSKQPGTIDHWLKSYIFINVANGHYECGKESKKYIINEDHYVKLCINSRYNMNTTISIDKELNTILRFQRKYKFELEARMPFQMQRKRCGRLFHPLIMAESEAIKPKLFSNWDNYDISAAAPNILYQLYLRQPDVERLTYIEWYLMNKSKVRHELSDRHLLHIQVVKDAITALFNGSHLGVDKRKYRDIDAYIEKHTQMFKLKSDPYLKNLKVDIKTLWKTLHPLVPDGIKNWNLYLKEESIIADVFIEYLTSITGTSFLGFFTEYDGFRLHKSYAHLFNESELLALIYSRTGYQIEL